MAILIVDDEANTRAALRTLLAHLGHKTILEAKNGEEALKVAEAEKTRIRMIIADWEMPYMNGPQLLERIEQLPTLDLAPFLLITSDLSPARLSALREKSDRLDDFLIKPFRIKSLSKAMHQAQAHRAATRNIVIAVEAEKPLLSLKSALNAKGQHWRTLISVRTLPELKEAVATRSRHLGAIVLQPSVPPLPGLADWLAQFSRIPLGTVTPVVCASRDSQAIFPYRTYCQFFVKTDADALQWQRTFSEIRARTQHALETELLFQELKGALQKDAPKISERAVKKILELDPSNGEAHSAMGDLMKAQGENAKAIAHFRRALETNPCQPRPYIRLLETIPRSDAALCANTADEAAQFCPQSQDVLLAAARSWINSGNSTRAEELIRRILDLNPSHDEARALLTPQ